MEYDCIVVGGGHAGCEAALACARMGVKTLMITLNLDTIAQLSCNPSMGGLGKSQLIFEIDALGGEIGYATDIAGIGFKMLNTKKGPAVWSLRAQVDRKKYKEVMQKTIMSQPNLTVTQDEVTEILVDENHIKTVNGVKCRSGNEYRGKCVILTTGTFLNGLIHIGMNHYPSGRMGELPSIELSNSLKKLGFELGRLKTGTSPRVYRKTIDFSKCTPQLPDPNPANFSHRTKNFNPQQVPCYITHTNKKTQEIILNNLDKSPLYQGVIKGIGPRYCPSIEDKCVKFRDKESHQVFIEPDGLDSDECYLNGLATSLPLEVQIKILNTIPALEQAHILRPGYGIEYDFVYPWQVYPTLETKLVKNLWLAGQILGTSGYEEAGAQGLMAGINVGLRVQGFKGSMEHGFVLGRYEAYIGVLIDDLVTKEIREPYRMFTSRVEHRLILRQDNAMNRLMKYGVRFGLVDNGEYEKVKKIEKEAELKLEEIKNKKVSPEVINPILESHNSTPIAQPTTVFQILKRPEINWKIIEEVAGYIAPEIRQRIELHAKYDGYIEREEKTIKKIRELENYKIPVDFDYNKVQGLSREAREKLSLIRPVTVGQATRISGVRFADITCLLIRLKKLTQ